MTTCDLAPKRRPFKPALFFCAVLMALGAGLLAQVVVGGREFKAVKTTIHWDTAHPDAADAKRRCLEPDQQWSWWETRRGQVAFCHDEAGWLVIVFAVAAGVITLITGYLLGRDQTPEDWLRRPSNRPAHRSKPG